MLSELYIQSTNAYVTNPRTLHEKKSTNYKLVRFEYLYYPVWLTAALCDCQCAWKMNKTIDLQIFAHFTYVCIMFYISFKIECTSQQHFTVIENSCVRENQPKHTLNISFEQTYMLVCCSCSPYCYFYALNYYILTFFLNL